MKNLSFFLFILFTNTLFAQYPQLAVDLIPDSLLNKAYSVVRNDEVIFQVEDNKSTYTYSKALTVLDKKHAEQVSFAAFYSDDIQKVKDIKIEIIDADGKIIKKVKNGDISDGYAHKASQLISNSRYKHYHYTTNTYPITIRYSYSIEDKNRSYIRPWQPIQYFNQSIEQSIYRIANMNQILLRREEHLLEPYNITNKGSIKYTLRGQKALTRERYMPALSKVSPRVSLNSTDIRYYKSKGKIHSWPDYGRFTYNELFKPKQTLDLTQVKTEMAPIIGTTTDKKEIAKRLYEYIQEQHRYIYIGIEDGRLSPIPTTDVHDKKYGDCKALSWYYNTLLDAYEIENALVFVEAGSYAPKHLSSFVNGGSFNHVFSRVEIDKDTIWVDCTSSYNPFAFTGGFTDNRYILIANKDTSYVACSPALKNQKETSVNLQLDDKDHLVGHINVVSSGTFIDDKLGLHKYDQKDIEKYKKENLFPKFKDISISKYSFSLDTSSFTFYEESDVHIENEVEILGDYITIPLDKISIPVPKLNKDKNRTWDIQFKRDRSYKVVYQIKQKEGSHVIKEDDIRLESTFGKYERKTTEHPDYIEVSKSFSIYDNTYSAKDYPKLKRFFDKIRKAEKMKLTLSSKS